jgi:flagellar FliJ protein
VERIQLLRNLLEREIAERDAALMAMKQAELAAQAAREQAETLLTYRDDYRQRWSANFAERVSIEILRSYQGFIQRLDTAIVQQQAHVARAQSQLGSLHQQLRRRETRVATAQRLIERRLQAHALQLQRREQKVSDEASQRKVWASRGDVAEV